LLGPVILGDNMSQVKIIATLEEALELRNENKLIGLFEMDDEVYHSHKLRAMNQSGLIKMMQSPAHYKAWKKEPTKETPALRFGKMFHMSILEPDKFKENYITDTLGKLDMRKTENKIKKQQFEEENQGKIIIEESEYKSLTGMQESFKSHPYTKNLISGGYSELACFWKDSATGILCKCKFDYFNPRLDLVIDLKTTEDASKFAKSAAQYDYHFQNAWYLDAARNHFHIETQMIFIPIEKTAPYGIRLIKLTNDDISDGRDMYKRYLEKFSKCLSTDSWPCYDYELAEIEMPRWKNT
jgi:hypothetical protein